MIAVADRLELECPVSWHGVSDPVSWREDGGESRARDQALRRAHAAVAGWRSAHPVSSPWFEVSGTVALRLADDHHELFLRNEYVVVVDLSPVFTEAAMVAGPGVLPAERGEVLVVSGPRFVVDFDEPSPTG